MMWGFESAYPPLPLAGKADLMGVWGHTPQLPEAWL